MPLVASAESEKPNGPRSRKGVQTRARLLEAAERVFEESGFLEARISDIAETAGLSHGSFYHYFESKEEIFREVAAAVEERLSEPMATVILDRESSATPPARIREAIRRHLKSYRAEAKMIGVIEQVSRYDQQVLEGRRARHDRYSRQVAGSIRQLQEHGLADPGIDPMVAASIIAAMTNRFPEMWLVQGLVDCSFDRAAEQLSRAIINLLGLDSGPPPGRAPRSRAKR
jgi:AcrR family transcriptional regulator